MTGRGGFFAPAKTRGRGRCQSLSGPEPWAEAPLLGCRIQQHGAPFSHGRFSLQTTSRAPRVLNRSLKSSQTPENALAAPSEKLWLVARVLVGRWRTRRAGLSRHRTLRLPCIDPPSPHTARRKPSLKGSPAPATPRLAWMRRCREDLLLRRVADVGLERAQGVAAPGIKSLPFF